MTRSWWRRLVGDLTGAAERDLVAHLVGQLDATADGAAFAHRAVSTGAPDDALDRIREIENRGDDHRAALVDRLSTTLVTPFDREDLFRVSRSIDDVLDNIRDFVRQHALFGGGTDDHLAGILESISQGCAALRRAVEALGDRARFGGEVLAAKEAGKEVRRRFERSLVDVLSGEVDARMLRRRELLRRLDVTGLRLGQAADHLADAAVKRST